jgi:hypothetical protein
VVSGALVSDAVEQAARTSEATEAAMNLRRDRFMETLFLSPEAATVRCD